MLVALEFKVLWVVYERCHCRILLVGSRKSNVPFVSRINESY